jgi:glycosyl transferase family 25
MKTRGIVVYVINLDRSPDRLRFVLPRVLQMRFPTERISAIDGQRLSESDLDQYVDTDSFRVFQGYPPKRGEIGCSLSHFKAWEKFLQSSYRYALIVEDDITFPPETLKAVVTELMDSSNDWDVVNFNLSRSATPLTLRSLKSYGKLVVYLKAFSCAGAYLINRQAAARLLTHAFPIKMPVDVMFTRGWEFDIKFTIIEPHLAHQTFGNSDIQRTTLLKQENAPISLTFYLRKMSYKIKTHVMRFFYNLKMYLKESRYYSGDE